MQVNTNYLDIVVTPKYSDYKEVCMTVKGKPYLVKIPTDKDTYAYFRGRANRLIIREEYKRLQNEIISLS